MSNITYRVLSILLFFLGIVGIALIFGEAIDWSREWSRNVNTLMFIFGCITAISFWASGIFFERGWLSRETTITSLPKWVPFDLSEPPDRIISENDPVPKPSSSNNGRVNRMASIEEEGGL